MKKSIIYFLIVLSGHITFGQNSDLTQFFFIRHAEKIKKGEDPALTKTGSERAIFWAEIFKNVDFNAVYSTQTKRTINTALPTANQLNLEIIIYETNAIDFKRLAEKYKGQKVLIVGHSNTIPDMINQILGEDRIGEIGEFNNSNLYILDYSHKNKDVTLLYIPMK